MFFDKPKTESILHNGSERTFIIVESIYKVDSCLINPTKKLIARFVIPGVCKIVLVKRSSTRPATTRRKKTKGFYNLFKKEGMCF